VTASTRPENLILQRIHSHNNFYYFTTSLVVLLLVSSFISSAPDKNSHLLLQGVVYITELAAYISLSLSRRWRAFVILILVLHVFVQIMRKLTGWETTPWIGLCFAVTFYAGMTYVAARQVLFSGNIEFNTIVGTIAVYLLLGIVWTGLYLLALEFWPQGIEGIEYRDWHDNFGIAAYFSYVTMTTLGYGDITPVVPITRTLAYLQAVTGSFYLAIVVASLVGAFARKSR
jgi:hypothetical protein